MILPSDDVLIKTGTAVEAVKAMLDAIGDIPGADRRAIAVAKTNFETAFLWVANATGGPGIFEG